jgi:hypothetical protein
MTGGTKAIKTIFVAALVVSSFTLPAYAQGFGNRKGGGQGSVYPAEKHPPVDEKAYKAALERIPEPNEKYDPWGVARPSTPAKTTNTQTRHDP